MKLPTGTSLTFFLSMHTYDRKWDFFFPEQQPSTKHLQPDSEAGEAPSWCEHCVTEDSELCKAKE